MVINPRLQNYGSEILDKFDYEGNNLRFLTQYSANGVLLPWMLGVTKRLIKLGEELGFSNVADHWRNKVHFSTLSKAQQTAFLKYYNFKKADLVRQGTPEEPLATPPKQLQPALAYSSSSSRSSLARPIRKK